MIRYPPFHRDTWHRLVISLVTAGIVGIVIDLWLLWDEDSQELWDKMLNTIVVSDPNNQLERRPV